MPCGGCGREFILTDKALELLESLGRYAFLPIGERGGRPFTVSETGERYEGSLTALKLYGLVTLDWDQPLSGFDYSALGDVDRVGSMALTKLGQDALEALSVQGAE